MPLTRSACACGTSRVIERLGLASYADRKARALSTGNLHRLGLACALLHQPELLILDEPASGLDPAGVVEIRELLASLAHEKGVTVFMSSHILTEVDRLAMRIGIIHQGRLIEELGSVPILVSGMLGPRAEQVGLHSFVLVLLAFIAGIVATFAWWRSADQA